MTRSPYTLDHIPQQFYVVFRSPYGDPKMKRPLSFLTELSVLCLLLLSMSSYGFPQERDDPFRLILEARGVARTGRYSQALEMLQGSLILAEESGQKLIAAIALNNIAEIYRLHENTAAALNYYRQALDIYIDVGNRNGMAAARQKIDELLPQPEEVKEISASEREKRIREAIERVRDRLRAQQQKRASPEVAELDYAAYLDRVKKAVVRAWSYPERASRNREGGKVEVGFTILQDGQLKSVRISRSSGYASMDREAVRAVRAAAPFHPIPEQIGIKQISIEFTFNYVYDQTQQESEKRR